MKLSPHFTMEEMTFSEVAERKRLDNTPTDDILFNLNRLAFFLEEVRNLLGNPIIINSAYRSPAVNAAVGGKPTSQHCLGLAADIRVPGMTPDAVVTVVRNSHLSYDQVIREFDRWTHISIPPKNREARKQALIIDGAGERNYA